MLAVNYRSPGISVKRIFAFKLTVFCLSFLAFGQRVTISDDGNYETVSKHALLEIHSSEGTKGILIPRMGTAQRLEMNLNPEQDAALMVYDLDTRSFWYWDADTWRNLSLPTQVGDTDADTYIDTEALTDEDAIRISIDGIETAIISDSLFQVFNRLKLAYGGSINMLNQAGPLIASDSSIATERVVKTYIDEKIAELSNTLMPFISVETYGADGKDEEDDTEAIQEAIASNPGKSIYFPDGTYYAHINVDQFIHLFSLTGEAKIIGTTPGQSVLEVNAPCQLNKLTFIHTDTTENSNGILNQGYDVQAEDCTFIGWEHDATHRNSDSKYTHCTFTVTYESLGTITWSPHAVFRDCIFDGVIGADVQDSKFYNCSFSGLWGVHMPEGTIDNLGQSTGFKGDAEFYNCEIRGSFYYAIGLGNAAHPKLYNCYVSGYNSGTYARTESTYEAYNCYIEAYRNGGASTAVKFSKYPTPAQSAIGLVPKGDSYYSNCKIVNVGSAGGTHVIVPARDDGGSVTFSNCSFDLDKVCAEQPSVACSDDIFLYIKNPTAETQQIPETLSLDANELIQPKFNFSGVSMMNVSGNGANVSGIKFQSTTHPTRNFLRDIY